ncbi:NAD-binding protein [Fomitiporia mediterranea MF3/22]|uniref:NAD-binding protein n=1 Tax=Fomitiporia mediterranea (strain MF3/22) TaxID=694068 RepID=UPI0004408151|nr:NAD-binding protein [Fomitiporia mediterranea MF3/22]EJD06820.1 NAD-binding protein [Fomitiporia mediterranea MF3/22]
MDSLFTQDDQAPVTPFSSYTPRVAIVTGGAQGLGYAISNRLADDGIDIAVNDIASKQDQINSVVEELRKKGRRAIAVPGDVSSEADVIAITEKTVKELGSVDIMVANAGIARLCSFLQTSVDTYDSVLGINARGVFMCFKYAALQMIKQGRGGRLIAASSIMGKQGSQNLTAYCASKFAVRGIVQTAAIELRRHGITVNAYAPGRIQTGISTGVAVDTKQRDLVLGLLANAPNGEPENVASLVSYLAKPESHFINGQAITADGGFRFD